MTTLITYKLAGTGSARDIGWYILLPALFLILIYIIHRFFRYLKNLPYYSEDHDDFDHVLKND